MNLADAQELQGILILCVENVFQIYRNTTSINAGKLLDLTFISATANCLLPPSHWIDFSRTR
jgi:hypothetical protein